MVAVGSSMPLTLHEPFIQTFRTSPQSHGNVISWACSACFGIAVLLCSSTSFAQETVDAEPDAEKSADAAPDTLAEPERVPQDNAEDAPAVEAPVEAAQATDSANEEGHTEKAPSVFTSKWFPEIHGFVSQGFIKTSKNNYLAQSERGSFEFTEVGLNATKQITDRFRVGMQLFVRDLGPIGNYKPQFDWFYLDYRFFDWLGLRAGRTKIPFGLYNEINDVDAARVPILLPQSVYPTATRDFLLAQTGGEIYGRIPLSKAGALEYQIYGGTIYADVSEVEDAQDFEVPYVVGGRVMWETPIDGLRAGGTFQSLRFDYNAILTPEQHQGLVAKGLLQENSSNLLDMDFPVRLWVTSLEYSAHDFLFAAEYGRWWAKLENKTIPVPAQYAENERFYVMANYRVAPWFTPGAYYSVLFPDVNDRTGREKQQHDVALTLRFDPIQNWLVKAEGHFMSGTAALDSALNGGTPVSELTRNWSLFMLKTTGYF